MGFLDELSSTLNRGAEVTARTAQSLKLKAQIADLKNQRNSACARLGAAAYDLLKDNEEFQADHGDILASIASCDLRISSLQEEVAKLEAEAAARVRTHWVDSCPCCGYKISQADSFCCRCGTKIPKKSAADGATCEPEDANSASDAMAYAPIDVDPIIVEADVSRAQSVDQPESGSTDQS